MKEVLSKKFWQDVKKTFDEAKAEPVAENSDKAAPDKPAAPPEKPDTQLFEA
jgi:hypothetical protein